MQTAFIGDVVLALPLAQQLRAIRPDAEIHMLVRKGNERLLDNHPAVDRVWIWDKKTPRWRSIPRMIRALRRQRFAEVYNLHRFASSGLITWLSGGRFKAGFDKNPFSWAFDRKVPHPISASGSPHEVQRNMSLLGETGKNPSKIRPVLYPSADDFARVDRYKSEPYFVLAPASVWFTKQWPAKKWRELCALLPKDARIFLVGGPADVALCDRVGKDFAKVENLAGALSFLQTAALMRDATRVFVNDSAPLHFASAMNAPTMAVFCSTVPEFGFGPLAADARVAEVSGLACRPCGLHGKRACPEGHFRCAHDIEPKSLLNPR